VGFLETIASAKDFLREHGRVSLRALQHEFGLDGDVLDELVEELVDVRRERERVLYWRRQSWWSRLLAWLRGR
jgi:hypothetical protein